MNASSAKEIDEQLIRDSQKGDRDAFARLLDLVYDMIYRFAFTWLKHVSDAEDVTQQVCIKLAQVIRQFRFESAFSTWLYRVVTNCVRDWQRSQKRHRNGGEQADEPLSSATSSESQAELERVLGDIDAMGKGFKETVLLVYGEGFSHAEAAEILNIKESTVSWRLHQVRKYLAGTADEVQGAGSL